jgi:hypothetical protein
MAAPAKIKISIKQPTSDEIKLREEFIELVKLKYRLHWCNSKKENFENPTNYEDELYPDCFEYFNFTEKEEELAKNFRDDLLMAYISTLPRATVDWLIFRRSMGYDDDSHVFDDKRYIEAGLVNNGWEFKGAKKLIDTWTIDILHEKIKKEKEDLTEDCASNIKAKFSDGSLCYDTSWYYDIAELKPYLPTF